MKTLITCLFAALISGFLACGSLMADSLLPNGDTISIQLIPSNGAVDSFAGATVGWGFTVNWTAPTGDQVSFTESSISDTNPALLANYTDYIGPQGGPNSGLLSPVFSPWTETFGTSPKQGVGAYTITTSAVPGAQDTGDTGFGFGLGGLSGVVFYFQIYNSSAVQIGNLAGYTYSTDFSMTVDAAPEPATLGLLCAGFVLLAVLAQTQTNSEIS